MSTLTYRPDIDGLRALAVMAVILFHAGVPFMGGGYVGVDVFFVISGYLITSILLKDMRAGTFTLKGFWERRLRRILPPLFVMVVGCMVAGWFLYLPDDFAMLGKEAAAQAIFSSNILFYKEAGYFDRESLLKPLLHTWSLAVEEQFYLFFPPALLWFWIKKPRRVGWFLAMVAAVSFLLCALVLPNNDELVFYMLPFRAWELLAGALIAFYPDRIKAPSGKVSASLLAFAGLCGVLVPVFLYDEDTLFPGWTALPVCLGTALLIWLHGQRSTWLCAVLSVRPLVFIGFVSYAWYLWHWPALVFVQYNPFVDFTPALAEFCLAGSFGMAVLSWKFVETPIRKGVILSSPKQLYIAAFLALALMGGLGWTIYQGKGLPSRLPERVAKYALGITDTNPMRGQCDKVRPSKIDADEVCITPEGKEGPIDFILWGDSQADAIAPLFFALSEQYDRKGIVLTHHGCESILDFKKSSWSDGYDCNPFNRSVFEYIKRHNIKHVFLISGWSSWMWQDHKKKDTVLTGESPEGYDTAVASGLARTIDRLREIGAHVYLPMDVPYVAEDPPRLLAIGELYKHKSTISGQGRDDYFRRIEPISDFRQRYGGSNVTYIDVADRMCPDAYCLFEHDGYSLYFNKSHLSVHGALYLQPVFEPYFKKGFSH